MKILSYKIHSCGNLALSERNQTRIQYRCRTEGISLTTGTKSCMP